MQVDFHDPLVNVLQVDGEDVYGVDPDPRRDASGFGPEDYELAIVVGLQPGHDYGWLSRCPQVLDCTYREHRPPPLPALSAARDLRPPRSVDATQGAWRACTRATEDAAPRSAPAPVT